jgi:cystathionine beta-lyase/cystathionine gamma-synthase
VSVLGVSIRLLGEARGEEVNGSMPCKMSHASIDAATRAERAFPEDLIRLCVGIEDVNDLIEDLQNAVCPPEDESDSR